MRSHALVLLVLSSACGVREPGLEVQVSVQVPVSAAAGTLQGSEASAPPTF